MGMYLYTICVQAPKEARRRHQIPQVLVFQVVVNCPVWVLGTRLRDSGRKASELKG